MTAGEGSHWVSIFDPWVGLVGGEDKAGAVKARRFDSATAWGERRRLGAGAVGHWRVGPASGSPRGGSVAGWELRRRVANRWDQPLG